jgi:hypothetical protein
VGEAGQETFIVRRFTSEVSISFFDKHDCLGRSRSALHLDPAAAVTWRKRSRPKANLVCPQSRIRYFENDAAYIFVSEEIVTRELEVVFRAFHVAEERVAPPAGKEADIAFLCNPRLTPHRNQRPIDDHSPAIGSTGGLRAINAADDRCLYAALEG